MTDEQTEIREQILRICSQFGDDYWLEMKRPVSP